MGGWGLGDTADFRSSTGRGGLGGAPSTKSQAAAATVSALVRLRLYASSHLIHPGKLPPVCASTGQGTTRNKTPLFAVKSQIVASQTGVVSALYTLMGTCCMWHVDHQSPHKQRQKSHLSRLVYKKQEGWTQLTCFWKVSLLVQEPSSAYFSLCTVACLRAQTNSKQAFWQRGTSRGWCGQMWLCSFFFFMMPEQR